MQLKRCAKCEGEFDAEAFFRRAHAPYASSASGSHPVCIGCEQTARDAAKTRDRWPAKVADTIRRHARRFNVAVDVLVRQFGWQADRLLHDAQHAFRNGCPYCRELFADMGHGLADITLDIVDAAHAPYYTTNTKWCCATCNREKSKTPPELWARKLAAWDSWDAQQERLRRFGPRQLLLGL